MRISPQPEPCNPCFLLQVTQALVIGIPPIHPRESCSDQLVIQAPPVWQEYHAHRAPVAIPIHDLHCDGSAEDQRGRELLGSVAERLTLLRAVDAMQPDALALAAVHDGDGVAVSDLPPSSFCQKNNGPNSKVYRCSDRRKQDQNWIRPCLAVLAPLVKR